MSKQSFNKQSLLRSLTAFSAALGVFCSPAVYADQITSGGVNFTGSQVQIGNFFTGPGTLTLNAENEVNGITEISGKGLLYVQGYGGTSTLNVIGDGTAGSASIQTDLAWFGVGADTAIVNIESGGDFVTPTLFVQQPGVSGVSDAGGTAQVHVTGANSRLQTQLLYLRAPESGHPSAGGFGSILVDGGALLNLVSTPDDGIGFATGGLANIGDTSFGGADGLLSVSGDGSRVHFTRYLTVRSGSAGGVVVENGAHLTQIENPGEIDAFLDVIGETETATLTVGSGVDIATVRVSGTGSAIEITRNIQIGQASVFLDYGAVPPWEGGTNVTGPANGVIIVEDGGLLNTPGRVIVSEAGSTGSATLTVRSGGTVEASSVEIHEGGVIDGDGGTIVGDVVNHAGTVAPGNSPGMLTFDGDYTQEADGKLVMQFAGTGAGQFDVLNITGDAIFNGELDLEFINGFAPQIGDVFDFLLVDGFFNTSFDEIVINGLASGWQYNTTFANGTYRLTSLNNAVSTTTSAVPVPSAAWMGLGMLAAMGLWQAGRRRRGRPKRCA